MNGAEFLTVGEAARRASVSRPTLRRMIARGDLPAFVAPTDRRLRLVKAEDIDALRAPRPLGEGAAA